MGSLVPVSWPVLLREVILEISYTYHGQLEVQKNTENQGGRHKTRGISGMYGDLPLFFYTFLYRA